MKPNFARSHREVIHALLTVKFPVVGIRWG